MTSLPTPSPGMTAIRIAFGSVWGERRMIGVGAELSMDERRFGCAEHSRPVGARMFGTAEPTFAKALRRAARRRVPISPAATVETTSSAAALAAAYGS